MSERITARNMSEDELFFGHKACAGCGCSLAVRLAMKVLGKDTFAVLPAGCMAAVGFNFPQLCFANNAMISPFGGTASVMTGVKAGLRALGISDAPVVGFAGDGGTADIGLQALSGAMDRNEDVLYICYDNEAYMNTGIQRSSLTPYGATTTTTPAGTHMHGNFRDKKDLFAIALAHGISYAATASIGYAEDFMQKVQTAKGIRGTKYIHVIAPCPTGWGVETEDMVDIAREVVDCGLFVVQEAIDGVRRVTKRRKAQASVRDHLKRQRRFAHLTDEDIAGIAQKSDAIWTLIDEGETGK